MNETERKYHLTLLNIEATSRKWAVAQGGNTPLALIARMARESLDMTTEQVDAEIKQINWGNGIRGVTSL